MPDQHEGDKAWKAAATFLSHHVSPSEASFAVTRLRNDEWNVRHFGKSEERGESVLFQKIPDDEKGGVAIEFTAGQTKGLHARVERTGSNLATTEAIRSAEGPLAKIHLGVQRVEIGDFGSILIINNGHGDLHPMVAISTGARPTFTPGFVRR